MSTSTQQTATKTEVTAENLEQVLLDAGCRDSDFGLFSKGADYKDEFVSEKADPLVAGHSDFPFEEVFTRLDGEVKQQAGRCLLIPTRTDFHWQL